MLARYWTLFAIGLLMLVGGLGAAAVVLRPDGVSVNTVYFNGEDGARMRAVLYRPAEATAERPAPGVLAIHGYLNTAEMQANFAIEFARRGYVVLAPDQRGHGGSDPAAFAAGFGGPDALAYLRSLPFVDRENVGIEGHSMGGWASLAAAASQPDGYKSLILEGSSVGAPFAPEGDTRFPRNLLVVFSKFDEFGGFMWGPESPVATGATAKAKALFGVEDAVEPGRDHGDIAAGTARRLETPAMTHPWLHHSTTAIGAATDWFARTLDGGRAIPASSQIWPLKEISTAIALLGIAPFLIGLFGLGLGLAKAGAPSGAAEPALTAGGAAPMRLLSLAALAIVPVASFLPLMELAETTLGQNPVFRQTFTNQISFWYVCNGLLALALGALPGMPRSSAPGRPSGVMAAIGLAAASVLALHLVLTLADLAGNVSPQAWFITLRPLTLERIQDFAVYLPGVLFFFVITFRAVDRLRPLASGSSNGAFAFAAAVTAGPFVVFLIAQYGALFLTGSLLSAEEGLRVIIAITFPPLMTLASVFVVAGSRLTGSTVPGAVLSALVVTWFMTATQPIGIA